MPKSLIHMERGNISSFFCCFKTCVEEELVKYDYLEICTYSVCVQNSILWQIDYHYLMLAFRE